MQTLRVIGEIPSRWELHTFYLFWSDFLGEYQEKPGDCLSPPGKSQNRNLFVFFLSIGIDPLNWQSFIEIGGMACPVLYWKTLEHVSKLLCQTQFKIFITIYREININCWEWEIVAWEKETTIRDYQLVFLSRWATASQRSVFLSKWRNNCAEDFTEFVYSLWSTIERDASLYHSSDHFGLEICARKLEEHTKMLITINHCLKIPLQTCLRC